jgi:Spy/CpxP family protein refolding chaperone
MKPKILLIISTIASALFIGSLVYAGGMGGGGMMGGGMGGGMMGGYGQGFSNPWQNQNNPNAYNNNRSDQQKTYQDKAKETEQLRQDIREKRQELSELYRSPKPDKAQIDKKIDELSRLEAELDQKTLSR